MHLINCHRVVISMKSEEKVAKMPVIHCLGTYNDVLVYERANYIVDG